MLLPIGVDDGHSEIDLVLPGGKAMRISSHCKAGELNQISLKDNQNTVFSYITNDGSFIVGDIDSIDSTVFDGYPLSPQNRVLVAHALRLSGIPSGSEVAICTGLPLEQYFRKNSPNERLIKAKMENLLTNDVLAADGTELPKIVSHEVVSESIGAWMDYIIQRDPSGKLYIDDERAAQKIGVIDVGGRTTDIAVIENWNIDKDRSATLDGVGMLAVKSHVSDEVYNDDRFAIELTEQQLNSAVLTGQAKLWGEQVDLSGFVKTGYQHLVASLKAGANGCLGSAGDLDLVLFVGGTTNNIKKDVSGWFRNQIVVKDPEYANGRGNQKYAELVMIG